MKPTLPTGNMPSGISALSKKFLPIKSRIARRQSFSIKVQIEAHDLPS